MRSRKGIVRHGVAAASVALAIVAAPAAHAATTLTPVADSYADASLSSTNYGALTKLRTDGSPVVRSYLRFNVQGWAPGSTATLRVPPASNLTSGIQVTSVGD